jgi:hypothetical protein
MVLTLLVPTAVMAVTEPVLPAVAGYSSTLLLENKNPTTWAPITGDGVWGVLDYNSSGTTFQYTLTASGLENVDYSLIYYANPAPGNNPGKLLGTGLAAGNVLTIVGTTDIGMSLPSVPDSNMVTPHNVAPDNYAHAFGAKIWLVPSTCYNGVDSITTWSYTRFLFETDLITYTDTDAVGAVGTGGTTFTTTVTEMPSTMGLTVTPFDIPFGSVYIGTCSAGSIINLHNSGTVPIKVTATTTSGFYANCLKFTGTTTLVNGWVSPVSIAAGADYPITVSICPTIAYSGTLAGSVSFMASYAP